MHNQHPVTRFLLLALIGLLAMAGATLYAAAQGSNLLQNPGFEGTYVPFANDTTRLLAPGWSAWNVARKPGDPSYFNLTPQYRQATRRIHGGSGAQEFFTLFATSTGGVLSLANGT